MKTVSVKGFISLGIADWDGKDAYTFTTFKYEGAERVLVMPYTLEFELPDGFDPRGAQVEMLKAEKKKAMADFQALVTSIDRKISELTALEHTA